MSTLSAGRRGHGGVVRAAVAMAALLVAGGQAEGAETLDLAALVQEALTQHPTVLRAARSVDAAYERPSRAGSLPDPIVGLSAQNVPIDDPGFATSPMSAVGIAINQGIPFPGKLGRREAVAGAAAGATVKELELVQTRVALAVRFAYWRLHFAEQAERISIESERVLDMLADIVHDRFEVGQAAQQDALQVEVAHSRLRADLVARGQAVVSSRRELNGAVGRTPDTLLPPTAPPEVELLPVDRVQLVATASESSPAVGLSRARVVVGERSVREASWDRWPDFGVGAGYRLRDVVPGDPSLGTDQFTATLAISLPIWSAGKQNARVREETQQLAAANAAAHATWLDVSTALETAIDVMDRIDRQIDLYQAEILPAAEMALDASISDYQVAKVGFVSVLQNWSVLLDTQIDIERLRSERARSYAEIQALAAPETRSVR